MNLNLEKLDQIEDELMKLGSPREIVPLLGLIIGKYAAIGAEELHIPLNIEEIMKNLRILVQEGIHFAKQTSPS